MGIIIKNTLVEVLYSISIVKRYYRFLQQVYSIIRNKTPGIESNLVL